MHGPAEITASVVEQFRSEQTISAHRRHETVPVRTAMIGKHHVYNCLVAAAVGLAYGIELTTVVRGLEAVTRVPAGWSGSSAASRSACSSITPTRPTP